ncbi:MAG: TonB-dependent receptor, partial [Armatimonadota bacterium]|nr:TonB-dependent receptor [Armatimonadota bacterium]
VQGVEDYEPRFLPSVGAIVPAMGGSVRASLKQGYRTPSFRELYLFGINNPNLRPETTRQLEVGFHRALPSRGELDVALFTIRASDLIQMGPRPAGLPGTTPSTYVNTPATNLSGAELNLRHTFTPSVSGYLNYSYLNPGAARAYNAMHKGGLGGDYARGRLRLSADLQWYDRMWGVDKASKVVRVPGFVVANARVRYQIGPAYDLWVGVENLFDREYVLDPSFPYAMPGRAFTLGIRARR